MIDRLIDMLTSDTMFHIVIIFFLLNLIFQVLRIVL